MSLQILHSSIDISRYFCDQQSDFFSQYVLRLVQIITFGILEIVNSIK